MTCPTCSGRPVIAGIDCPWCEIHRLRGEAVALKQEVAAARRQIKRLRRREYEIRR